MTTKGSENMGIFTGLFSNTNQPRDDGNAEPFFNALISMTSADSGVYVGAGALKNANIFAAVRKIAGDIASNPINYDDTSAQGARISRLLTVAPNSKMNAWSWWFAIMTNALLNGNSFARIKRNPSGQVTELDLIPNSEMTVTADDITGEVSYKVGNGQILSPDRVLHFKVFSQDGLTGISPLYALRQQMHIQHAKNDLLGGFFESGIVGTGILKVHDTDISAEAKAAIRQKFEKSNAGSLSTIIIDDGMDYSNVEVNTSALQIANGVQWTASDIASVFGLPIDVLGGEAAHSNQTQTMTGYLQSTLTYYFSCITSELNAKLATGTNSFSFDTSALFSADPNTSYGMYENAVKGGLMTPNEARKKLGLPAIAGGDQLVNLNKTSGGNNSNEQ